MMDSNDILMLSNEPLPESEKAITLEFLSEASLRLSGRKPAQTQEAEGKITFNPERWNIFFLPPKKMTNTSLIALDRKKWDLYLVPIRFTLHEAPGERYYEKVRFLVKLAGPQATAYDLFPKQVTTKVDEVKSYTISPHFKITEAEVELGQIGREIRFTSLNPTITAFGEGESTFYWVYKGFQERREVDPGTKNVLA